MKRAFVFPGQGSQVVGMGKELADAFPAAREVFEEVDDTLGRKLSALMFEGPIEDLTLTANAQPAIMAASMAALRVLEGEANVKLADVVSFAAGHSLGEYSALAAAGAFSLSDTARLLHIRGNAMQDAVPVGEGAMAAIMGLEFEDVAALAVEAAAGEVCSVANDNGGNQVVISGAAAAVDRAITLAAGKGAKRALLLTVSAPFHCAMMEPAASAMAEALDAVTVNAPAVPVVANVTAGPAEDPADIKRLLVEQVTGTVRWRECVEYMAGQEVEQAVEVGAGKVLSGLGRRIAREMGAAQLGAPQDIEDFVNTL